MGRAQRRILPIIVCFINIVVILYPREAVAAARDGLQLWAWNVLPSLFPFMVGVSLLTSTGFTAAIGRRLEPFTRRVLGLPGEAGFAVAAGFACGYPMGAKVTAELYSRKELTRRQANLLLSFVNNAGPLFLIGAMGVGMFNNARIGYFLLLTHYLGAICSGVLCRLLPFNSKKTRKNYVADGDSAINAADTGSTALGFVLGKSVSGAMLSMLQIGGFVILFRVVLQTLEISGILSILTIPFPNSEFTKSIIAGLVEMTNGGALLAVHGGKPAVTAISFVVGFGGLSVLAQSAAFLSASGLNAAGHNLWKLAHGAFSAIFAFILYAPLSRWLEANVTAFADSAALLPSPSAFLGNLADGAFVFIVAIGLLVTAPILYNFIENRRKQGQ